MNTWEIEATTEPPFGWPAWREIAEDRARLRAEPSPEDMEPTGRVATPISPWKTASNGAGKRHWFVCRRVGGSDRFPKLEYHTDRNGDLIRYTFDGATRTAAALNIAAKS